MLLAIIDIVYLLIVYLIYRFRCSKNEDVRMFNNDYEFYESLPDEARKEYWSKETVNVMWLMAGIGIELNLAFLLYTFIHDEVLMIRLNVIFIIAVLAVYAVRNRRLVKRCKVNADKI